MDPSLTSPDPAYLQALLAVLVPSGVREFSCPEFRLVLGGSPGPVVVPLPDSEASPAPSRPLESNWEHPSLWTAPRATFGAP